MRRDSTIKPAKVPLFACTGVELSLQSRHEITAKFARDYHGLSKGEIEIFWNKLSRSRVDPETMPDVECLNRLSLEKARPARKQRSRKYSYEALNLLRRLWSVSSGSCGKYLVFPCRRI